jgi:hypothetical protein
MKFVCQTRFDITATGIIGHYNGNKLPFKDRAGQLITDSVSWNRSRNQQRNWETLTQLISMRAQIFNLVDPVQDIRGDRWMFEFETEAEGIYGPNDDPTKILRDDASGIPMLRELNNDPEIDSVLITSGPHQNIWFAPISINS